MKLHILRRNGRLPVITLTLLLLFVANCDGKPTSTVPAPDQPPTITPTSSVQRIIGIQAGHGNGDDGASLCPEANKIPGIDNEADLNLAIATKVIELLRNVNGYDVHLFVGKDSKIKGLKSDAFVAIHADQGKPDVSGYKVSRFGGQKGSGLDGSGDASDRLVQAIWDEYGIATGLNKDTSPGHFTEDMLYYYGLDWIDTDIPGAIIEMGWLCDDLRVLLYEQENVALGIARGVVKFLGDSTAQLPPVSTPQPTPTSVTVIPERPQWLNQLSSNPIIPGVGLAGIELGYTESRVIDVLGKPLAEAFPVKDVNGNLLYYAVRYEYNGVFLGVYTTSDTRIAWSIRLSDSNFNKDGYIPLLQGITIGSTETQLLQSLDQPLSKEEHFTCPENLGNNRRTTTFKYSGISFWVCEDNKLVYLMDIP
jgi:N-acetylmuramoyl-L-alanine amidase